MFEEYEARETPLARVVYEAQLLEMAFQAKIYVEQGHQACQDWIKNVGNALQLASSKALYTQMLETASTDWWQNLKKLS